MSFSLPSVQVREFLQQCLTDQTDAFIEKMQIVGSFLYDMNLQVNLTAIKEDKFWSLHTADSLSAARYFPELFTGKARIADLGCGAGFPSLVLAAAFPQTRITAIDSTRKKIDFVNAAAGKASLTNLTAIHGRGNELARKTPYKAAFDAVFARAVASADILIREAMGFLKPDGSLIIFRTPEQFESELDFLKKWKKGSFRSTPVFELPDQAGKRLFLQIKQIREMH